MAIGLLLLGFVIGLVVGYAWIASRHRTKYLASAEYWVYLPGEALPDQTQMMTRMIAQNPYAQRGRSPVGPTEGLLFSDVRLHIALVLRSKNPHVFRPDLFVEHTEATAEHLRALADAQSLAKVRYTSEEPLPNKRHLQFLIHAADAIAELGEAEVIYDVPAERLLARETLAHDLAESLDATRPELHVRVIWSREGGGGVAQTRGLTKIGLSELRTGPMEPDEQVLVTCVLEEAARGLWALQSQPQTLEVGAFGDMFRVLIGTAVEKERVAPVRIMRVHPA